MISTTDESEISAWWASSAKRVLSALRLSSPVRASVSAVTRCAISAAVTADTVASTLTSSATDAISSHGWCSVAVGATPAVASIMISTVRLPPARSTRGRKRAAASAPGITIQGSSGLVGPPVVAAAAAITSVVQIRLPAIVSSGRGARARRRSSVCRLAALSANSASRCQPRNGAANRSVTPMAAEPMSRARRTRGLMSSARRRSASVGHSHETRS